VNENETCSWTLNVRGTWNGYGSCCLWQTWSESGIWNGGGNGNETLNAMMSGNGNGVSIHGLTYPQPV
jgi:hypothetical protein